MKNFTPYLLLAFIVWVAMRGTLQTYVALASHINWNVQLPAFLSAGGTGAAGGATGGSSGGGGFLGTIGNAFGFVPSVLGNLAGSGFGSSGAP